jgi:DNA-binding HxlR family transcriptional regulator
MVNAISLPDQEAGDARAGLLTRDDARPGQRATYSLTEAAIQLVPVLTELGTWGPAPAVGKAIRHPLGEHSLADTRAGRVRP